MKQILLSLVALLGVSTMAMAEVTFTYTVDGTNATITGVTGAENALTIPSTVSGTESGQSQTYTVVAIGDAALHNGSYTSVTIPLTVTSIGNDAFANCTSLTTVTFGDDSDEQQGQTTSLRLKGEGTEGTSQLLTIGNSAFNGDVALAEITIPASVVSIGNDAFAGCVKLATVEFEEGSACESIGASAFNGCSSLASFAFPAGVTVVSNDVLSGCTSLAEVTFSDKTTEICGSAFASCEKLTSVELPSTLTTIGYYCFGESGLTSITIPANVTSIGDLAFAYLIFDEEGVVNNSNVVLTSSMFYGGNLEADYMEWEVLTDITIGANPALISWESLEGYRYVKFEIELPETPDWGTNSTTNQPNDPYAIGAIYYKTGSSDWKDDLLYELPTTEQGYTASEVIYKIKTLKAAVEEAYATAQSSGNDASPSSIKPYAEGEEGETEGTEGFYVAAWSPATSVTVLVGPKAEETEAYAGYLSVTLSSEPVTTDQETTVSVTTNSALNEVTMSLGSISVSGVSLTDVAITFNPQSDGSFTGAEVSGTVGEGSISTSATGSFVIDENGEVTFSANFTYILFNIGVSFTTIAPTTEGEGEEGIIASIDLLPNFTNDWADAASYDATTNTVTWLAPGGYDGNGAWFGSVQYGGTPSDFSDYDGILVTFTIEQDDYFQLTIEYDNGTTSSNTGLNCVAGENTLYLAFDPDGITEVTQCYVQCGTIEQTVIVTYAAVVKYGTPSAISSVSSDTEVTEVARYNLIGQKISGAEKGINIIVYSDGSAKKVLVK